MKTGPGIKKTTCKLLMIIIWVRLPFHKMLSRLLKLRHLYFKNDCKKFCNYCARVFTKLLTNSLWFIICVRLPFQMTRSRLLYLRHTYFKKECNKFVKRFMKTRPSIQKTTCELLMIIIWVRLPFHKIW